MPAVGKKIVWDKRKRQEKKCKKSLFNGSVKKKVKNKKDTYEIKLLYSKSYSQVTVDCGNK